MLQKKIKGYQKAFTKHGVDPRALQWWGKKWADLRYKELTEDIDFEGMTILDVGCGFADIIPFIKKKTKKFKYTGVDLVPEFIEVCIKKYPKYKFFVRDYYGKPLLDSFDVVISSGTLNANIKSPYTYRQQAINTLFNHADKTVAFNMAGGYPQPKNKDGNRVYYADSERIVKYCYSLTKNIIVRNNYLKRDFIIIMAK